MGSKFLIQMNSNEIIQQQVWYNSTEELSVFCNYLSNIYPLKPETVNYINKHAISIKVLKGKHLIKKGDICDHVYFIKKGVLRAYLKVDDKEITTWISAENELVTSIKGFYLQEPASKYIQALENTEVLALHRADLQYMYKFHDEMNFINRKLLEKLYVSAEDRALISRLPQAMDRYKYFLETRPNLIGRVPLKYIASYLSVADETLSRIRTKIFTNA